MLCSLQRLYSSWAEQYWKTPKSLNRMVSSFCPLGYWGYWLASCKALHRSAPKRNEHDPGTMRRRSSTASDKLCAEEGSLRNCKNCHGSCCSTSEIERHIEHMVHPLWLRHIALRARRKPLTTSIKSTNILALARTSPLQDLSTRVVGTGNHPLQKIVGHRKSDETRMPRRNSPGSVHQALSSANSIVSIETPDYRSFFGYMDRPASAAPPKQLSHPRPANAKCAKKSKYNNTQIHIIKMMCH